MFGRTEHSSLKHQRFVAISYLAVNTHGPHYNHQSFKAVHRLNYTEHINTLTYLLTPWCTVLLEKLTGLQLVKKFPTFLWNPKVHYRTHKRPPPVPILGQSNPVHIPTSHLLEIHPNIQPSTPRSPQWSLSLRFPHQDPIRPPLLTHTRHMPSPSHSRFYHPLTIIMFIFFLMPFEFVHYPVSNYSCPAVAVYSHHSCDMILHFQTLLHIF